MHFSFLLLTLGVLAGGAQSEEIKTKENLVAALREGRVFDITNAQDYIKYLLTKDFCDETLIQDMRGCDINIVDFALANEGNDYIVDQCIAAGADLDIHDYGPEHICPPILAHAFSPEPNVELVKKLVNGGAKVNVRVHLSNPLIHAIQWKKGELVKFLLKAGSDPHMVDLDGNNALHNAFIYCDEDILKDIFEADKSQALIRNYQRQTPIEVQVQESKDKACHEKHRKMVKKAMKEDLGTIKYLNEKRIRGKKRLDDLTRKNEKW